LHRVKLSQFGSKVTLLIQINEALTQGATLGGRLRLSGATRSPVRRLEE
jgi:hypothetical protein